jgi:oligopeptide transport system ATP-binding protein
VRETLLEVINLKTYFYTRKGIVKAVDGIDLKIHRGEILGLVGESGCGKSMTAYSIIRLVTAPPGRIVEGKVLFEGEDLLRKTQGEMRMIRGGRISMIFQDPMSSLNPAFKVGDQISESIRLHQSLRGKSIKRKTVEMMEIVGIPEAVTRAEDYPHQFSGGMRQRIMIAMAVSCNPVLLLADEPTTALDVTIQAQILELLGELREKLQTSILLITHDLGVVAEVCDQVAIMYCGRIVEYGNVVTIFRESAHPYTKGLLGAIPRIDESKEKLQTIKGTVPSLIGLPGCQFYLRCDQAKDICRKEQPESRPIGPEHRVSCFLYD